MAESSDLEQILRPFYGRAAEAEERLSRLEAVFASKKGESDVGDEKLSSIVRELQLKLDIGTAKSEQMHERELHASGNEKLATGTAELVEENRKIALGNSKILEENMKLEEEITKLKYRVSILIRALKEANGKLELK